jgi:nitrate reductase delta subunit
MMLYKILSALLSYPSAELRDALPDLRGALAGAGKLPRTRRRELERLMDILAGDDLYTVQERYVALFDRGRALSLHLFEHVHGESRDRGQAMVDLTEVYRHHGLELAARELPDYVPLFLEFLSQIPAKDARELLAEAMPILTLLGARLAQRDSAYSAIFDALEALAGKPANAAAIRRQAADEGPDQTLAKMDQIWEEEAVTFLGSPGACQTGSAAEQPVRWVSQPPRQAPTYPAKPGGN